MIRVLLTASFLTLCGCANAPTPTVERQPLPVVDSVIKACDSQKNVKNMVGKQPDARVALLRLFYAYGECEKLNAIGRRNYQNVVDTYKEN